MQRDDHCRASESTGLPLNRLPFQALRCLLGTLGDPSAIQEFLSFLDPIKTVVLQAISCNERSKLQSIQGRTVLFLFTLHTRPHIQSVITGGLEAP